MSLPCNLHVYITVEAVTLIGLTLVAVTSLLLRLNMAHKKKKSGAAAKPPLPAAPKAAVEHKVADAPGPVTIQEEPAAPAVAPLPVMEEIDTRPETSPYASPPCTIPFASPLTVPLDFLQKSPRLQAAYENRLPELPDIPEDIGHVLVHYLHTGTYESLKPKETESPAKEIYEFSTSIRAYATARTYDLPDLMRLAQIRIEKFGDGLTLPALLEITRDAHPTLSEADDWFLDYLKSRIRPHLEDPKALLGSDLLDRISSILSPNRVLLRTVLEMFCERLFIRPDLASSLMSPGSSRPNSPPPHAASPVSVLHMRSRTILREEFPPTRKKATPWPSPEETSLASWSKEASPEPILHDLVMRELDLKSEPEIKPEPEHAFEIIHEPVLGPEPEPEPKPERELSIAIVPEAHHDVAAMLGSKRARSRRERKDSAKVIDLEHALEATPVPKELEPIEEPEFDAKPRYERNLLREVDSGFWDFSPPEAESVKEHAPSIIELEPEVAAVPESIELPAEAFHNLESIPEPREGEGIDERDFAAVESSDIYDKGKGVETETEASKEPEIVPAPEAANDEVVPEVIHELLPEPLRIPEAKTDDLADEAPEKTPEKVQDETDEVEAKPETEKAPQAPVESETADGESQPAAEIPAQSDAALHDNLEPTEPAQPAKTEPSVEPRQEPAWEPQTAGTGAGSDDAAAEPALAVAKSDAEPAPKPAEPKAEQQDVVQTCGPQIRQKSWRKRLMRYPVLFGRGM